jgi:hypothetical protein
MLTDEEIDAVMRKSLGYGLSPSRDDLEFARAIESAACAERDKRIAELEERNRDLYEDVQRFKEHALNEKAARLELKRQLEEARKDAERYRYLRETRFIWGDFKYISGVNPTVVGLEFGWFPTQAQKPTREDLDAAIDAAMQKGQS